MYNMQASREKWCKPSTAVVVLKVLVMFWIHF